ncbi:MAG: hypothetical protein KAT17_07965 [Candidatus Aminicenantes bacterium]|nr:hypothetical protein [Candidatus Aminicenantes bacterium]
MNKIVLLFLAFSMLASHGCLSLFKKQTSEKGLFEIEMSTLEPDQFPDYINQLQKISQKTGNRSDKKRVCFYIAKACVFHKNPTPDYKMALHHFEAYLKLDKSTNPENNILNWINLLNRLIKQTTEMEQTKIKMQLSERQNQILYENIKKQDMLIQQLEKKIKKLDSLYFQIERKKKKNNQPKKK